MPWNTANLLVAAVLLCVFPSFGGSPSFQNSGNDPNARTLTFKAASNQPTFTLHISARGQQGIVYVLDGSGSQLQTLTCPLDPSQTEAVSQQFVERFAAEDLDLDGNLDLRGTRSFGAKWALDYVWLFDPQNHNFYQDSQSEQMEHLSNLTVDAKRQRVISYSIGPANPLWDEYRIEHSGKDRPYWPRLIPVESCFIDTGAVDVSSEALTKFTLVVTRYASGRPVVERHPITAEDKPRPDALCGWLSHR